MTDEVVLPSVVTVSQAFASRGPSQAAIDVIVRREGGPFQMIMEQQGFRVTVFRKLMEMFPGYDLDSLWSHSYYVEPAFEAVDPTSNGSPTAEPSSANTSAASPATSTT
jgi:hypothetical protein